LPSLGLKIGFSHFIAVSAMMISPACNFSAPRIVNQFISFILFALITSFSLLSLGFGFSTSYHRSARYLSPSSSVAFSADFPSVNSFVSLLFLFFSFLRFSFISLLFSSFISETHHALFFAF
jgi:hypothetical protein